MDFTCEISLNNADDMQIYFPIIRITFFDKLISRKIIESCKNNRNIKTPFPGPCYICANDS